MLTIKDVILITCAVGGAVVVGTAVGNVAGLILSQLFLLMGM